MTRPRLVRVAALAVLLGTSAAASSPLNVSAITRWLPVTEEERNLKASKVDPEAGAEALFWRVHVVDAVQGRDVQTVLYHYLRIKVFNQRGCATQGTQDIYYSGKHAILDVAGRTIKPDGTIVELNKDAIFRRDIVKAGGRKFKAVSFAMPAVEPGVILEYHWREVRDQELANYVRMEFQRDIPVREVTYFVRPLVLSYETLPPMRRISFGPQPTPFVRENDDFFSTTLKNVPAYKEEPLMPSEWVVRPWTLLYYADDVKASPEKYWADEAKKIYALYEPYLKASAEVREAADAAVAGARDPEERLAKMLQYCRTKIKSLSEEDLAEQLRAKSKAPNKPSDTLKRGVGSDFDVKMLFAAMARQQGFEVRVARLGDRTDVPFERSFLNPYFLRTVDIAVKAGDQWRFYDAANKRLPAGMLPWQEEGSDALISDPKEPLFVHVPFSAAEKSLTTRTGDVRLAYTGHGAAARREDKAAEAAAQQEADVRDTVHRQFSGAEISAVKVENVEDAEKPLAYSYHVKVPGYALRTGKRLFVQLGYFERGRTPRFPAGDRTYEVWFEYPWAEEDRVTIKIPPGLELENAEAPASFPFGELGGYEASAKAGDRQILYQRKLVFGRGGRLMFPLEAYPKVKHAFDRISEEDQHAITLRQQPAVARP
jgi:hypothetical protein